MLNACFRRTSHRRPHPIEREMDQAIKDSQNKQSNTSMDERVKVRRPSVKQKYMGHRNARCVRSQRIQKFHLFSSLLNKLRTASILVEENSLLYCFCSSPDISSRSSWNNFVYLVMILWPVGDIACIAETKLDRTLLWVKQISVLSEI